MGKKALKGFSLLQLAPIVENTTTAYSIGEFFNMPEAQSLTQETDSSSEKVYADDALYLDNTEWNGINSTITFAEMTLEKLARLGFGTFDSATNTLKWKPQGSSLSYAATFRALTADGEYRMYRRYVFMVTEIRESGLNTKGQGTGIGTYQLIGTFTSRKIDDSPGEIHDGTDLAWLNAIDTAAQTTGAAKASAMLQQEAAAAGSAAVQKTAAPNSGRMVLR
ncbi:MAG: hypothetical protein LBU77_01920 [Clostridiales bacterium]|jgi:hypothetical protein|nr:hypothetical protein [Clostridiales bacterium]